MVALFKYQLSILKAQKSLFPFIFSPKEQLIQRLTLYAKPIITSLVVLPLRKVGAYMIRENKDLTNSYSINMQFTWRKTDVIRIIFKRTYDRDFLSQRAHINRVTVGQNLVLTNQTALYMLQQKEYTAYYRQEESINVCTGYMYYV